MNRDPMKKLSLLLLAFCLTILAFGQSNENAKLIELAKFYKDYMFRNEATKEVLKEIQTNVPENLKVTTDFIAQTITTKNSLLTQQFLSRPGDLILKQIYIVSEIFHNFSKDNPLDNNKLIDSLMSTNIPTYELVDNYYGMLFIGVGNKNQPFNFSKIDFQLKDYQLKDDTEKGILFLRCMDYCGKTIWGFMNIVDPPNTKKAFENIKKFPKFNGQPYYQYSDFYFTDFEVIIVEDKGPQSYKSYYLDKYYETLLSHLICLNTEKGSEKEAYDLLLGSILREKGLYKFTQYKETLEEIFKERK